MSAPEKLKPNTLYARRRRARLHLDGLNSQGHPYVNKRRPRLRGLKGNAYHAAYMKMQREEDRRGSRS